MDPVLQTFQQRQSGSAEGQGFGNFFAQGRQLSLSQQHLNLQKKAEARAQAEQDALLPLQKQLLQYKAINDGLQLGKIVTDADVLTEMNAGIPKVNDLLARFMRSKDGFNDSALLEEYNQQFAQKPWLFSAGNGAKVTQGIEAARAQRTMWVSALEHEKELRDRGQFLQEIVGGTGANRTELRFGLRDEAGGITPETRTITDPETQQQVTVYRTGPRSWARVPKTLDNPRATTLNNPVTGNPEAYVQTGPNNFSRIPMSTGEQQLVQTEIASANIFEKGRQLLPLINDRTTSVGSNLQRTLRDSKIGIFLPDSFLPSAEVTEADAVAREFMAQVVRGLRSDGNITGKEAQDLMNEANSVHWVNEKTGKARVKTFVQGAVRKAREASLRLGRPINEKYLTIDELGQRAEAKVDSGEMTREQAMDWAVKMHLNSADALISDINQQIGR